MALIMDNQEPHLKHFCKICKKGNMRAHGLEDEDAHIDDDDPPSDWDDKIDQRPSNERMYALRTNPNRLKSCMVCEQCGKKNSCWKTFLSHDGKCSSEDAESLVDIEEGGVENRRGCGSLLKRKRTSRMKMSTYNSNCDSSEDEDLANCLVIGNGGIEPKESFASGSKEEEKRHSLDFMASKNLLENKGKGVINKGLVECKACKKVFTSHQALGGHRASHKNVKGCYASRRDNVDDSLADEDVIIDEEFLPSKSTSTLHDDPGYDASFGSPSKRMSKVHDCSICHRVFSSGQALGGHKRSHWITSNVQDVSSLVNFH